MRFWPILFASACWAQMPQDAARLLDAARVKVLRTSRNLPRYTCQETIVRDYLDRAKKAAKTKETCPAADPENLVRTAMDRVRLEVAVSEGSEIHAWPGASKFDSRSLGEMVTSGPLSTGAFGTILGGVFDNPGARFEFAGERTGGARRVFRYRYSVPVSASHYQVKLMGGTWWNTAYSGEFEIAADTGDLETLTSDTGSLNVDSGMCRAQTTVDYDYEKVGEGGFLIPRQARLRTMHPDGSSTLSTTTFSACHEYLAESTIRFDDADAPAQGTGAAAAQAGKALPGWTPVVLKLAAAIDTDRAAAGDVIWATLVRPVVDGKKKQVLAPAGSRVRGRILMMKHYFSDPPGFDIDLGFDRYERSGVAAPFAAVLVEGKARAGGFEITLQPLDAGGELTIHTKADRIAVPAGMEAKWMTLTPQTPSK